jgi:hypothetical protein
MSTFGKKALIKWDYDLDIRRYNNTPKEMQLKILEKWYPRDYVFLYQTTFSKEKKVRVKLINYVENNNWLVIIQNEINLATDSVHPFRLKPGIDLMRELKINTLLESDEK